MIEIHHRSGNDYEVTVDDVTKTTHRVTLRAADLEKLGGGDPETLIEASFQFLLAREPNTSILREFDLPVIGEYFPEYEIAMRTRS